MSPVSFFYPDFKEFEKLQYVEGDYHFILQEGDCVYIPAYYFYQYVGIPNLAPKVKDMWPSAMVVTLKYPHNSDVLRGIFDAVESNIVK
jgi:hypothetical protein